MKLKEKVAIAIVIILVVAFIFNEVTRDGRHWNNGKCPDCGVAWELVKEIPSHHANEGAEIWQCPNCHKTITLGTSKSAKTMIYICLGIAMCSGIVYIIKTKKKGGKKHDR